jgi:hypothetical protein
MLLTADHGVLDVPPGSQVLFDSGPASMTLSVS